MMMMMLMMMLLLLMMMMIIRIILLILKRIFGVLKQIVGHGWPQYDSSTIGAGIITYVVPIWSLHKYTVVIPPKPYSNY